MNSAPEMNEDDFDRLMDSRRGPGEPGARQKSHWHKETQYSYDVIAPHFNHVLIIKEDDEDAGGLLIIPEAHRPTKSTGVVKAVGPGKVDKKGRRVPVPVEVGDRVAYKTERGMNVQVGGEQCRLIKDDFVLGRVVREDD
jgi:chaperonin GroES